MTNKERLDNLEAGLGMLQDEFEKFTVGIDDRIRGMESSFQRTLEENLGRMQELVASNREGGSSAPRRSREPDTRHSTPRQEETLHPFAPVRVNARHVKLEFPKFSSGDPTEWMSKAKQYFAYHDMPVEQRVSFASYHLTEEANEWWQAITKARGLNPHHIQWEAFEMELWTRFGPMDGENFDEALSHIRQKGSLIEYQREFERLQNKVEGWTEKALVGTFMGGLHTSISSGIRIFKPKTLTEVINLARMRDDQLQQEKRWSSQRRFNQSTSTENPRSNVPSPATTKHSEPQLFLMESEQDDEENEDTKTEDADLTPEITLHALTGWDSPTTLRLRTEIGKQSLLALVDSGSTHNFISERVAQRLRLPITPTTPFSVRVASGAPLKCGGRYEAAALQIGDAKFTVTLHALPLVGLDLVLGVTWLESLGPVICDWKAQTMQIDWDGKTRILDVMKEARQGQTLFAICLANSETPLTPIAEDFQALIQEFEELFATPTSLPPQREIEHRIALKEGTDPVNVRPYRYAYFQKEEIEKQVSDMLGSGIIRPSSSPFSSPVLLVKKKDGSWRFCTDYRALNNATIKDRFPIPTVDDMLDELHGAAYFTKLDLTAGYHQVRMHAPDIPKTAFRTHNGHYEYLVMPFGLCNAPSTFQALMNSIFRPLMRKSVLVFFDDILIYSKDWDSHLIHVREVFSILQDNKLSVKFKKCDFGKQELEYLGHIITNKGVKVDDSKILAMTNWPAPTNITELRGFLGLTGYYRKFVQDYGLIARPLTNRLRRGQFTWDEEAETAFNKLKRAMTTTPTLALPDFSKPFVIQTDASGEGIGAILSQNDQPIAFMSRSLGAAKKLWSTYAREMLAIIVAIRTWRPYVLGQRFTIQTDQRSLRYLLEQRILTPEQQKWMGKLVGYDYEIVYKPGKANAAADALSRVPDSPVLNTISAAYVSLWNELRQQAKSDPYLLRVGVTAVEKPGKPYAWKDGLLCYNNRVIIPPGSPLIAQLLHEHHDTPMGGYSGVLRTFKRLARQFYWPSMHKTVMEYVSQCDTCQRAKSQTLSPAGLLQPLPIPNQVWEDVSMDFVDGLPKSNNHTSILVVVDRLSKAAHLIPLTHPYSASQVAVRFIDSVVRLHGIPRSILSDRDPIFQSNFWRELWKQSNTKLRMSSAYHPQSDGQTEVVNRCIEQFLRCFVQHRPTQWSLLLPWAEYWYNTTFHASTGMSPFEALYGRAPPLMPRYEIGSSIVEEIDAQLQDRDEVLSELKENLQAANNHMKQMADRKRRDIEFQVGDWVFLRLQPYRQKSVIRRSSQKLANRFFGPFQIEQRVGKVAYRLKLPEGSRIHPVFHVSLLKQRIGEEIPTTVELPPLRANGLFILHPETVLKTRQVKRGTGDIVELLIKWKDLPIEDATWEEQGQIQSSFPAFVLNLEDKVLLEEGSVDRIPLGDNVLMQSKQSEEVAPRRTTRARIPNQKYLDQ